MSKGMMIVGLKKTNKRIIEETNDDDYDEKKRG